MTMNSINSIVNTTAKLRVKALNTGEAARQTERGNYGHLPYDEITVWTTIISEDDQLVKFSLADVNIFILEVLSIEIVREGVELKRHPKSAPYGAILREDFYDKLILPIPEPDSSISRVDHLIKSIQKIQVSFLKSGLSSSGYAAFDELIKIAREVKIKIEYDQRCGTAGAAPEEVIDLEPPPGYSARPTGTKIELDPPVNNAELPLTELPDGSGCFTATIMSEAEAMALPVNKRPLNYRISGEIYTAVFEAVGHASMCWNPRPGNQTFDSAEAEKVALNLCFRIANDLEKRAFGITRTVLATQLIEATAKDLSMGIRSINLNEGRIENGAVADWLRTVGSTIDTLSNYARPPIGE
jgi:hypothetical protein